MALLASATVLALAGAVHWQAPTGCPTAAAVEGRVHALLGRVPAEHELLATGVVSGGPPWRLELETTIGGRHQQRTLEADDCLAVTEAAALILAVSVDPLDATQALAGAGDGAAASRTIASSSRTTGAVETAVAPVRVPAARDAGAEVIAAERERVRPRPSLRLRIGGGAEAVAIPGGTGGGRLGLAIEGERAFVQIEGSYWVDRFAPLRDELPPSGAWVGLGTITVQGGVRLGGPRLGVPLGAGLEAGGLRTRAEGLAGGRDVVLPWCAGVVGLGIQWSASRRVALWAAVEGVLPLARGRVRVGRNVNGGSAAASDDVVLHEAAAVGARALAGISIRIVGSR